MYLIHFKCYVHWKWKMQFSVTILSSVLEKIIAADTPLLPPHQLQLRTSRSKWPPFSRMIVLSKHFPFGFYSYAFLHTNFMVTRNRKCEIFITCTACRNVWNKTCIKKTMGKCTSRKYIGKQRSSSKQTSSCELFREFKALEYCSHFQYHQSSNASLLSTHRHNHCYKQEKPMTLFIASSYTIFQPFVQMTDLSKVGEGH